MNNTSSFHEDNNTIALDHIFEESELWYLTENVSTLIGYYSKPDLMEQSPRVSLTEYFGGDQERGVQFYSDIWDKIRSLSQGQFTTFVVEHYPHYLREHFDEEDAICILFSFLSRFVRDEPVVRNNAASFFTHNKQLFNFSMYIFRHVQSEWFKRGELSYAHEVERQIHPLIKLNEEYGGRNGPYLSYILNNLPE